MLLNYLYCIERERVLSGWRVDEISVIRTLPISPFVSFPLPFRVTVCVCAAFVAKLNMFSLHFAKIFWARAHLYACLQCFMPLNIQKKLFFFVREWGCGYVNSYPHCTRTKWGFSGLYNVVSRLSGSNASRDTSLAQHAHFICLKIITDNREWVYFYLLLLVFVVV